MDWRSSTYFLLEEQTYIDGDFVYTEQQMLEGFVGFLDAWQSYGLNSVSLTWFVPVDPISGAILDDYGPDVPSYLRALPTDERLALFTKAAHDRGFTVSWKTNFVPNQAGEGNVNDFFTPAIDVENFLSQLRAYWSELAPKAEQNDVELVIIGGEQGGYAGPDWDAEWREIIAEVRGAYDGEITYDALGYIGRPNVGADDITFWDALDYIGISMYLPLANDDTPTLAEAQYLLQNNEIFPGSLPLVDVPAVLQSLSEAYDKPLLFTEIGANSSVGALANPTIATSELSYFEQSVLYTAHLDAFSRLDQVAGMNWWNNVAELSNPPNSEFWDFWFSISENQFPFLGKPSGDVLRAFWGNDNDGAPINGDLILGDTGDDLLRGQNLDDILIGSVGNDTLIGLEGLDRLMSGDGADFVFGGGGDDVIYAGSSHRDVGDEVFGGDGNDFASGGHGNDTIEGNAGDDILSGDLGADTLDGGDGRDTATYQWAYTGVAVDMQVPEWNTGDALGDVFLSIENVQGGRFDDDLRGNDTSNVLHGQKGDDTLFGGAGNDTISGENGNDLLFGEVGDRAFDPASAQVVRVYQATLARWPDTAGHQDWTERLLEGTPLLQIITGFVGSREFQNRYGDTSNEAFVTLLYENVLDRLPDATGLADWLGRLDSGTSREEVVFGFSESAEFKIKTTADTLPFSKAGYQADWSDDVFRLYQATLDRLPDVDGFEGWTNALADGRAFLDVVTGFVASREFQNVYGDVDDAGFVTLLYNNVLDRDPDETGFAGWTEQLANGTSREQVVRGFSQSVEFQRDTAPVLKTWLKGFAPDDHLDGGAGDDVLFGGIFADNFAFSHQDGGWDIVADFEAWDTISLDGFGFGTVSEAAAAFVQNGSDAVLNYANGQLTILNVQASDLGADELILV